MKKNNLLQIAVTTLLMANSFVAIAGTDYPAADFEPKVLYQDASVKSSAPAAPAATTKSAPAATASVAVEEAFDAKYPATNFAPKVLYVDESYKHTKSTPSISTASSVSETVSVAKVEKEDDSNLLFLGLLAAAAVGGFAFAKSSKTSSVVSHDYSVYASGETGVTRYLNARIPKVSGVSKYLERNTIPTNVARYIARQNVAHKSSAQNDTDRG